MKLLVDKLPESSKDCLFAEYISMTSKFKCGFKSSLYSRCKLETGKECPYLKEKTYERSTAYKM